MTDQKTLWLQYLNQAKTLASLEPGEAMQAVYPFQPWGWGGESPSAYSYSYEQWLQLDVVPAAPYLNTNTSPATQTGFSTAYHNWANMLAVGDLATDEHYATLQRDSKDAQAVYIKDYQSISDVFLNQTKGTGTTLKAWLDDPAQAGYASQIASDKATMDALQDELNDYGSRIATPVKDILNAFNDPSFQGTVTEPDSGKSVVRPIWQTSPVSPWEYLRNILGGNADHVPFGKDATNGNSRSFTLTNTDSEYTYDEYYAAAGGEVWDDFLGLEAEGSFSRVDWSQFTSEYTINFQFQDLTRVAVKPDAWFQGSNLTTFGNGPYATGFSAFPQGNDNYFFGPGGALSRIYSAMVVAYRPTITISAGTQFSTYMKEKWQAEAGIIVGPFVFGGETSGEKTRSTTHVSDGSLILASQSDWPVILGMVSAWTRAPQS